MKDDRLVSLAEVAARHDLCTKRARYHVAHRTGRLPVPCLEKPYQFRASDVDRHIAGLSVTDQRTKTARQRATEATS